jgi:hypothetical protein
MADCGEKAILIVTTSPEGTSTNIVRSRAELRCVLSEGHSGLHRDGEYKQEWSAPPGQVATILRHEDEV